MSKVTVTTGKEGKERKTFKYFVETRSLKEIIDNIDRDINNFFGNNEFLKEDIVGIGIVVR